MDFHQVYDRYAPAVQRFAFWLCGDVHLAQDLTSETFVRAWLRIDTLRQPTLRSYLFAITRNLYLEDRRKHRRQVELAENLPASLVSPLVALEQAEQFASAGQALSQLGQRERTALLLRAVEQMSYAEIAAALGLSLSTAKVVVHRARLKLLLARQQLEEK
ncbi:MAG: RNA polymerase sigma factor [Anaerolineales bacterium]|nr:RNA polymerase sigma factor [Anaerolineales bacterium]MCW5855178.1 RNA polymerase sigma factor [Anaerolineales bacterium]